MSRGENNDQAATAPEWVLSAYSVGDRPIELFTHGCRSDTAGATLRRVQTGARALRSTIGVAGLFFVLIAAVALPGYTKEDVPRADLTIDQRTPERVLIGMSQRQVREIMGRGQSPQWEYKRNDGMEYVFFSSKDERVTGYTISTGTGPLRGWSVDFPNRPIADMRTDQGVEPGMLPEQVKALMGEPDSRVESYGSGAQNYRAKFVGGRLAEFRPLPPPPPMSPHAYWPPGFGAYFEQGQTKITPQGANVIKMAAADFSLGNRLIVLLGAPDPAEPDTSKLTHDRVDAVRDALVREGVPASGIRVSEAQATRGGPVRLVYVFTELSKSPR